MAPISHRMPPASANERHQIIIPSDLVRRIRDWRSKQPDLPNKSEAIRRLVEIALEVEGGARKPAPKGKGKA
jgi:hypothetical protein